MAFSSESQPSGEEQPVPPALMFSFVMVAVFAFLMVFSGKLNGDIAAYSLLGVIAAGAILLKNCSLGQVAEKDE